MDPMKRFERPVQRRLVLLESLSRDVERMHVFVASAGRHVRQIRGLLLEIRHLLVEQQPLVAKLAELECFRRAPYQIICRRARASFAASYLRALEFHGLGLSYLLW